MVLLTVTPRIADAIRLFNTFAPTQHDLAPAISHPELAAISASLQARFPARGAYTLTALVTGASVAAPAPPAAAAKTPEYIALMARLRLEAEEREYRALQPRRRQPPLLELGRHRRRRGDVARGQGADLSHLQHPAEHARNRGGRVDGRGRLGRARAHGGCVRERHRGRGRRGRAVWRLRAPPGCG